VGRSPGASGRTSVVGTIATIDSRQQSLVIVDGATRHAVAITPDTRVWVDRSGVARSNLQGTFADLKAGLRAEVKYAAAAGEDGGIADWIKVQAVP
jgi:hypothetical protein